MIAIFRNMMSSVMSLIDHAPNRPNPGFHKFNTFLSPSKQSRLGIKIVLINIMKGTTAVAAGRFQSPLFSFHANSIDGLVTESIALAFWQTILRKSRFQVSKQNNQGLEVVCFDWQS